MQDSEEERYRRDPWGLGRWKYFVGATLKEQEIDDYEGKLQHNGMMRVFYKPGAELPPWKRGAELPTWKRDKRLAYCARVGAVPFISTRIKAEDRAGFNKLREWLTQFVHDVPMVYLTNYHEPEGGHDRLTAKAYKENYTVWWNEVIEKLEPAERRKVKAGPVLTGQYSEHHGFGSFDPGPKSSDFYGVDMYMDSWEHGGAHNEVATKYQPAKDFLAGVKDHERDDERPLIFPELGAIGLPHDHDGSQRAKWIRDVSAELDKWHVGAPGWKKPWSFLGWVWWNAEGTASTPENALSYIGQRRFFQLDQRHNHRQGKEPLTGPQTPLAEYNRIAGAHYDPGAPLLAGTDARELVNR